MFQPKLPPYLIFTCQKTILSKFRLLVDAMEASTNRYLTESITLPQTSLLSMMFELILMEFQNKHIAMKAALGNLLNKSCA
jgi:hypothetical protein